MLKGGLLAVQRIRFVQDAVAEREEPLSTEEVRALAAEYVDRNAAELEEVQAARRPGRPADLREVLLREQRDGDEREFEAGYWMPDVTDAVTLEAIKKWNGRWVMLNTIGFIRVTREGERRESGFPPTGKKS
jgi:translation machinery-associated protein 16